MINENDINDQSFAGQARKENSLLMNEISKMHHETVTKLRNDLDNARRAHNVSIFFNITLMVIITFFWIWGLTIVLKGHPSYPEEYALYSLSFCMGLMFAKGFRQ